MAWTINDLPERRDEPGRKAYAEGFRAGIGMARKYVEEGKTLDDLQVLVEAVQEASETPDEEESDGAS